jgi:thioredoxin reductase
LGDPLPTSPPVRSLKALADDPDLKPVAPAFDVDAAVVGGGPAGLSAALTLGRAGRPTVVFDAGEGRNARARHAHGYLTRDGLSPEDLRRKGRAEAARYGAEVRDARVEDAEPIPGGFRLTLDDGQTLTARILVVATGVVDELPDVPGVAEAWGRTVVHCPYCHGHEFKGRRTAVLGRGDSTYSLARLLRGWTDDLTIVTNGPEDLDAEQERTLAAEGIRVRRAPVVRVRQKRGVVEAVELEGGDEIPCAVLYVQPPQRMGSPLAERLGAHVTAAGRIDADADGRTNVPGLFVAGDILNKAQEIATAVAGGMWAGIAANHDLVCGLPEG